MAKNKDVPNTLKYSIWNTRTKEINLVKKEKYTESIDRSNLESKTTDNQE
ncbi:hypothetical protein M1K46_00095 [Fictibacillus sp. WQ 8-8]|nr:hypothetical protein [Fictibacillus sp. WQ 8-8]MCQ6264070.1 hypothetical protein [Fictibacillus sp. WQ 8-8]